MNEALLWLLLNLFSIVVLSYYSMMEMALVSVSKIRLQFAAGQGNERAKKLDWLLHNPTRLFGTTLIGVNVAMMFGSEFSRQFHEAIGVNPDFAPLTQVIIVIIFGELAPMLAARRHPEQIAFLGANLLWLSALVMKPFLFILSALTHSIYLLFGGKEETLGVILSQEELTKFLEVHHEEQETSGSPEELTAIISNIFALRSKTAGKIMTPLELAPSVPSQLSIEKLRQIIRKNPSPFALVHHRQYNNIVGVIFMRDLLRESNTRRVADCAKEAWMIPHNMEIVHVLHQFRSNKQNVAIVINDGGSPIGYLTLQDVLDEIFSVELNAPATKEETTPFIDRTFPGSMLIAEFNRLYGAAIDSPRPDMTLGEYITEKLGHHPYEEESITVAPFEFIVKESTLLEVKEISVKTL